MSILEKLTEIFRVVFDDDSIIIRPESTANDIDGWDSLSHVNLIVAVETNFAVRFTQKELLSFRNVGDLAACVERKVSV